MPCENAVPAPGRPRIYFNFQSLLFKPNEAPKLEVEFRISGRQTQNELSQDGEMP